MMAHGQLLPAKSLGYNVVAWLGHAPHTSLTALAELFPAQAAGQAEGDQDAKRRELACFLYFWLISRLPCSTCPMPRADAQLMGMTRLARDTIASPRLVEFAASNPGQTGETS